MSDPFDVPDQPIDPPEDDEWVDPEEARNQAIDRAWEEEYK